MRSVRRGGWKLIQYDALNGQVRETQLFNLRENPDEYLAQHHDTEVQSLTGVMPTADQQNLADDPRYAAPRAELEALLLAEMRRLDDPYRLWYQPDDGLTPPPDGPPRQQQQGQANPPAASGQSGQPPQQRRQRQTSPAQ